MALDPIELFPEVPNLYEFPSVHAEMIYDVARVNAYAAAIQETVRSGDVVCDVGTGTGLLGMLCLQAGARHVYAIDQSPIIDVAREIAEHNGLASRMTFIHGKSYDVVLPERVDVVVSELIGHAAFEEGMTPALFDAKKRFLRLGGVIIPSSVTLHATPIEHYDVYDDVIDCWKPVHGLSFLPLRDRALANRYVTEVTPSHLLAVPAPAFQVDFVNGRPPADHIEIGFEVTRCGRLHGMAFWFDSSLSETAYLSTGPRSHTHWHQCFAPVATPIDVETGDSVQVLITMTPWENTHADFALDVAVSRERVSYGSKAQTT